VGESPTDELKKRAVTVNPLWNNCFGSWALLLSLIQFYTTCNTPGNWWSACPGGSWWNARFHSAGICTTWKSCYHSFYRL